MAAALRVCGWEPLEVYPFATLRLLGLPCEGKRTELGRHRIHRALQDLVPRLDHPTASEHQLDAVVCALTARLWREGKTRTVGAPDEGLMTIPDVDVALAPSSRRPGRRAAETPAEYATTGTAPAGEEAPPSRRRRSGRRRAQPDKTRADKTRADERASS
jgi:hypothetical protein